MTIKFNRNLYLLIAFVAFNVHAYADVLSGFIENKGQITNQHYQTNNDVKFQLCRNNERIQLRNAGYSYELFSMLSASSQGNQTNFTDRKHLQNTKQVVHRIDIDFVNANPNMQIVSSEQLPHSLNYVINGVETYGVKSFRKVLYKNVFKNVDIEFQITGGKQFKYNVILNPGANLKDVKFQIKGAEESFLDSLGNLVLRTSIGDVKEEIPFSFYLNNSSTNVPVQFKLNKNLVTFEVEHNNTETLVIDPSSNLIWGNYIGGSALDYQTTLYIDPSDNIYTGGYTFSSSNIATSGVYQTTLSGSFDAYLVKTNTAGLIQWGTYFGGTNVDVVYAVRTDTAGNIYAGGDTFSNSNIASAGAHQTTYGGGVDDCMLFKFDPTGQRIWSTYYGGIEHDIIGNLAIDNSNNVIITGHTDSNNNIATPGAYSTIYATGYDVFVAKFNPSGVLQWGTYYGDTGIDEGWGIDCDEFNNIYVAGFTSSLFNITAGTPHQSVNGGGSNDAFIAKFNPAGNTLIWGTFYGGNGEDAATALKYNGAGMLYISGNTNSTVNISTPSAYQPTIASAEDGYVTCFNTSGVQQWGTYFGGSDADYIYDLYIDVAKNILFCGQTVSPDGISTLGAYQASLASTSNYDAFFTKFTPSGLPILGTYFGGSEAENSRGISTDSQGKVYLAGETTSSVGISNAASTYSVYQDGQDAFLAKFCITSKIQTNPATTASVCLGGSITISAPAGCQSYSWSTTETTSSITPSYTTTIGTYTYSVKVIDADGCDGSSDTLQVNVLDCITSLNDHESLIGLNVYPNPASNVLMIVIASNVAQGNANVYDVAGKRILTKTLFGKENSMGIEQLLPGIYLLEVETNEGRYHQKFIKQ